VDHTAADAKSSSGETQVASGEAADEAASIFVAECTPEPFLILPDDVEQGPFKENISPWSSAGSKLPSKRKVLKGLLMTPERVGASDASSQPHCASEPGRPIDECQQRFQAAVAQAFFLQNLDNPFSVG